VRRTIITLLICVAASAALLASMAAARPPEPRPGTAEAQILRGELREPVLRPVRWNALLAAEHNAVLNKRAARGLTTNPGPVGNDTAPHTVPSD
jgi:hypothetical protein